MTYQAKSDYQSQQSAQSYEQRDMYKGIVGRRRVKIETDVIARLAAEMNAGSSVLDCPCGNGRWFAALADKADKIIAIDVSTGMVAAANERGKGVSAQIEVCLGDAENLDLADGAVDYVFSYALMKHLPVPVQYRVLSEFGRVSWAKVICSFAVFGHLSYAWWRRRRPEDSYPIMREELDFMAKAAGLRLERLIKVSQPIVGLEYFAVFGKATKGAGN